MGENRRNNTMEQKKMTIDALMEQGKANGKLTTKEIGF